MKLTDRTKGILRARRQERELLVQGYRKHETDWEIHRGYLMGEKIVDAVISECGGYVFTKISHTPEFYGPNDD